MTLRILVASDAPWATSGYSNQVRQFAPAIAKLGHDVAFLATFGLHGGMSEYAGLKVYPGGADAFANDVIAHSARDWQADIVITLKDAPVFRPEAFQGVRWLPMTPIDHEPIPPAITNLLHHCYRPIAYAPNGFRELRKAGFDPLYAPHSFDPAIFHPDDRAEARKAFGLSDDLFVIGTVAVNRGGVPSRKAWPQNLEAFAIFGKDKPNARLFLHTDLAMDGFEGGMNIPALLAQLSASPPYGYGWDVGSRVLYCDQERYRRAQYPDDYLRTFYSAIDVLNCVSLGEGFGLPGVEAQACGTPVIMSDFAAHRDLCWGGWHVTDGLRFYDGQGSWVFVPQPEAIAAAMEEAYEEAQTRVVLDATKHDAVEGAAPHALGRVIAEHWKPLLEEVERDIRAETSRGVLRIVRPEEVGITYIRKLRPEEIAVEQKHERRRDKDRVRRQKRRAEVGV